MPLPDIQVEPVRGRRELKSFVTFPWKVYRGDPNWVPPLIGSALQQLERHSFRLHAEVEYFLARRGGAAGSGSSRKIVGRIAAIVNHAHNEFHGEKTGFFGFFESLPDPLAPPLLLQAAADWLRSRGMERMRGPASFSSNEEWGLLIDGFERPPMVMMTYNPPAYAGYFADFGLIKAKDLVAYHLESATPPARLVQGAARLQADGRITIRSLNPKRYREEVERVREIYNVAWEKNWGFIPMTAGEIDHMAKELKPVVDPDFLLFAELEGKTVGFTLALPDANQALKKANGRLFPFGWLRMLLAARKIRSIRVLTLGVLAEHRRLGIDTLMYLRLFENGARRGIREGEFSWILEDNVPMRRALDHIGARVYKTYRIYDYPLGNVASEAAPPGNAQRPPNGPPGPTLS